MFLYFFEIANILLVPKIQLGAGSTRQRTNTDNNFADTEVEELVAMLRETENLEEQGDILQVNVIIEIETIVILQFMTTMSLLYYFTVSGR